MGFNLKNVETGGNNSAIPAGRYNLTIVKTEITKASTGSDMIKLQMKVSAGQKNANRYCFDQLVFTDSSMWKVKNVLEAAESKLAESEEATLEGIAKELLNAEVSAYLEEGLDNQQRATNNVKQYQPVSKDSDGPKPKRSLLI